MFQLVQLKSTQHLVWLQLLVWLPGVRPSIHKELQQGAGSIVNLSDMVQLRATEKASECIVVSCKG